MGCFPALAGNDVVAELQTVVPDEVGLVCVVGNAVKRLACKGGEAGPQAQAETVRHFVGGLQGCSVAEMQLAFVLAYWQGSASGEGPQRSFGAVGGDAGAQIKPPAALLQAVKEVEVRAQAEVPVGHTGLEVLDAPAVLAENGGVV